MIIIKYTFGILCGLLYVLGLLLGFNYEEISVYLCIYGCPIICTLSALALFVANYKRFKRKGAWLSFLLISAVLIGYVYLYIDVFAAICDRYGSLDRIDVHSEFVQCQNDLIEIAQLNHSTYEYVNLVIYAVAFPAIVLFNFIIYKCMIPRKNISQSTLTNPLKK